MISGQSNLIRHGFSASALRIFVDSSAFCFSYSIEPGDVDGRVAAKLSF